MSLRRGLSPVQRTLRACREAGRFVDKCEHWNPYGGARKPDGTAIGIRQDLFGFADIIALDPNAIVAIQTCAGSGHAAHRQKIIENVYATAWLIAGGHIELWSWRKVKVKRGGKAERWQARVENITQETLNERKDEHGKEAKTNDDGRAVGFDRRDPGEQQGDHQAG